jgi:hypothetical protein
MPAVSALRQLASRPTVRKRARAAATLAGLAAGRAQPVGVAALRATGFFARTGALAATQALLGTSARWVTLQLAVATARWLPRAPGLRRLLGGAVVRRAVVGPLAPFAVPLACLWGCGLFARVFAPALHRNFRFWRKSAYIYSRYRATKMAVAGKSADQRDKMWAKRHEWGAEKVYNLCVSLRGSYLKDGQVRCNVYILMCLVVAQFTEFFALKRREISSSLHIVSWKSGGLCASGVVREAERTARPGTPCGVQAN